MATSQAVWRGLAVRLHCSTVLFVCGMCWHVVCDCRLQLTTFGCSSQGTVVCLCALCMQLLLCVLCVCRLLPPSMLCVCRLLSPSMLLQGGLGCWLVSFCPDTKRLCRFLAASARAFWMRFEQGNASLLSLCCADIVHKGYMSAALCSCEAECWHCFAGSVPGSRAQVEWLI